MLFTCRGSTHRVESIHSTQLGARSGPRTTARTITFAAALVALPGLAGIAVAQQSATSARATSASSAALPATGQELLQRMHDRWATGQPWFQTLTFVQRTTVARRDGSTNVSTWYEALLAPDRLRIDFGNPSEGNGALYTADSVYVIRDGKVARKSADGNPFLPFVVGVYTQPLDRTLAQLAPLGVDMEVVRSDRWRDRPVFVVGARDTSDVSSAQFWVDAERLILLRMVLAPTGDVSSGSGRPEPLDIHLDDYVEVGGGWLATKIVMYAAGSARQTEEYSDWRTGVELSPELFVAEEWGKVPHWAASKP